MGVPPTLKMIWPFSKPVTLPLLVALPVACFLFATPYQRYASNHFFVPKETVSVLDPTATNWKTFTNTLYGYTLQYFPANNLKIESWDAYGNDPTTSRTVGFTYKFNEPGRSYLVGVEAGRGLDVDATKFSQWVRDDVNKTLQKTNTMTSNISELGRFEQISVANRPAIYVEFLSGLSEGVVGYAVYILDNNDTVLGIFTGELSASQTKEKKHFATMVSTFHFTAH